MKHARRILVIIALVAFFTMPAATDAHELIPKALKEYIQTHPNATPAEIKAFADSQSQEFGSKFQNGIEIIENIQAKSGFLDNTSDFLILGVKHILSGPDHILFVLSLLLMFISWKEILRLTGTFTVAHTITLLLAGTGIVVLSSNIVEPLIAFSIAYVAIATVFFRNKKFIGDIKSKVGMVFFFGLFHGLGFAGLLQEIEIPADKFISSLISFNLGIEFGQILIVASAFPFIYFFKNKSWYPTVIKGIAIIIALLGIFWGIQRMVG